jgi:autotransporter-associated beta strand protein
MCCFGCTEPGESGQTTKEQCEALGGFFMGLGTTECLSDQGQCRTPFDEDCCEHVVSSSQRLTFTGPRDKRCPQLSCGFVATVTVSHETPVYVNGGLIGDPYAMCTSATTFFLCNDEFHVTPYPCTEKFHNLDIEVCWSQGEGQNVVPFQCCQNITHLLGNCDCECVTTLLYEGGGCTSNAVLLLLGDAIVDASGTGPLVLTSNIQTQATCLVTLTLQGDNANNNSVQAIPDSASHATSVWKLGTGRWVLNAASDYTGSTTVHKGELVLGVNASGQGQSGGLGSNSLATITIGDAFGVGTASLLLKAGVTVDSRTLTVPGGSQLTVLGGVDTSGIATFGALNLATINVSRNIRLQAATGGTVVFNNAWSFTDATNVTIGSAGNAGTVQLGSSLGTAGAVSVQYGTLQIADGGDIPSAASIHLGVVGASTTAELDYAISGGTISRAIVAVGRGIIRNSGGGTLTFSDTITHTGTELEFAGDAIVLGDITGTGDMTVSGSGSVTINGENTLEGATTISGGSLVIANPPNDEGPIVSATFTHSSLTVYFSGDPDQGSQYALLAGPTIGSYSPTLMGTTATGTYDSSTSTLTIS